MDWAVPWTTFAAVSNWFKIKFKVRHCHSIDTFLVISVLKFLAVVGPGPHKIENEEAEPEPDFNLLPQRDAPVATE